MEDDIQIRKTRVGDIPSIVELHRRIVSKINAAFYSPEIIKEWLVEISKENVQQQFNKSVWIVATNNGEIIGFGQYSTIDGEIYQINVSPDHLNQYIGKKLYDHIENNFRENGVKEISLNSTLNAVDFYQKLGFEVACEVNFRLKKESLKMIKMKKSLVS